MKCIKSEQKKLKECFSFYKLLLAFNRMWTDQVEQVQTTYH